MERSRWRFPRWLLLLGGICELLTFIRADENSPFTDQHLGQISLLEKSRSRSEKCEQEAPALPVVRARTEIRAFDS